MNTVASIPKHIIHEENGLRSIEVNDWRISATTRHIVTAFEADALQKLLGIPLPEMTFGQNKLELLHIPTGWTYTFDVGDALRGVKNGELGPGDGAVKVGYADAWLKSRTEPGSSLPMPKTVATKPYDWTYTTVYPGHEGEGAETESSFTPAHMDNAAHTIPIAELTRPDPILFYAEIPLFEDELHDNGSSHLLVRIRVMPGCIFILSRFTLRVDNVLFRVFDTRLYHSFTSSPPLIIKESSGWEAPYDVIKSFLPKKTDLSPLTDANFIAKTLGALPKSKSQGEGAGTGWRGLCTSTGIAVLKASPPAT